MDKQNYVCVSKGQREADAYHALWMTIPATSRGKAKAAYAKHAGVPFTDVSCVLEKNFKKLTF